jgi:hypothetical protein
MAIAISLELTKGLKPSLRACQAARLAQRGNLHVPI